MDDFSDLTRPRGPSNPVVARIASVAQGEKGLVPFLGLSLFGLTAGFSAWGLVTGHWEWGHYLRGTFLAVVGGVGYIAKKKNGRQRTQIPWEFRDAEERPHVAWYLRALLYILFSASTLIFALRALNLLPDRFAGFAVASFLLAIAVGALRLPSRERWKDGAVALGALVGAAIGIYAGLKDGLPDAVAIPLWVLFCGFCLYGLVKGGAEFFGSLGRTLDD